MFAANHCCPPQYDPDWFGGIGEGAAMAAWFASLPAASQRERVASLLAWEMRAKARKAGEPEPVITITREEIFEPRPIPHPEGRPPRRNKSRDRRQAQAAQAQAPERPCGSAEHEGAPSPKPR
jgi:hypothetical protein